MAARRISTVSADLQRSLRESRRLAADAQSWSAAAGPVGLISLRRRDSLIELAFFRGFLAWEAFLEEVFVLYLLGQRPPRGRAPHRFAFPPNHETACAWVVPERRDYADWTNAAQVIGRAQRFFRDGKPFAPALRSSQNALEDARIIRNAIAHRSMKARDSFESLVRRKLTTVPPRLTVGGFLNTTVIGVLPPQSFLDSHLDRIDLLARQIVPI